MFGAAMSQGAQALQMKPVAGGYTNDYYASKQRDCQIIRIQTSDPELQINCGNLRSNFTNAASITGAHMQDIYYAFKSFTTAHRFYNAEQGMKLEILIPSIQWISPRIMSYIPPNQTEPTLSQVITVEPEGNPINLDLNIDGKQCLSEQEMVDYIHEQINILHAQLDTALRMYNPARYQVPDHRLAFLDLFDHIQVAYMSEAKKLSLYANHQANGMVSRRGIYKGFSSNAGGDVTTQGYALGGFEIVIRADPSIDPRLQFRLARMLGFTEEIEYQGRKSLGNKFAFPLYSFLPFQRQMIKDYFRLGTTDYWNDDSTIEYRPNLLNQAYYDSCKNVMQMVRYPRLYIRSSLLNNIWRADGSKGDDIAVVPIVGDITKNIVTYESNGNRTFEVKETNVGALSFMIRITDEHNELIEFIEDYELQLAFFYVPDKMVVSQF